jgi:hypothetical protein
MAAQKKSKVAQENATRERELCGDGWFLALTLDGWGVRRRERDTHLDGSLEVSGSQGRARAYGQVPKNRGKKNLTLIASMSLYGLGESMCVEGATDAAAFEVYIEHFLAPALCEGQVVVMDNLLKRTGLLRG